MVRVVWAALMVTLVGVVSPQCITPNDQLEPPPTPDLAHISPFTVGLFKELYPPGSDTGNFFFSPFNIWNALVLAYFGSAGTTREQLGQALQLKDPADTLATYRALDRLNAQRKANKSDYVIDLANRVYVNESFPLRDCVRDVLSKEVQLLNFNQMDTAAATINHFVSNTTRGKITNIVTEADMKGLTMALVNAASFKGFWVSSFSTFFTRKDKFYTSPDQYTLVDMMSQDTYFNYGNSNELGAEVVELPYKGGAASMFVLLPHSPTTGDTTTPLDNMLSRLTSNTLSSALASLQPRKVIISIPKFKLEHKVKEELKEALQRLGIQDLFTRSADLSVFDPLDRLTVKDSIHKAVVEVNEDGTEAAGATVVTIGLTSAGRPFTCNRPFVYFIQDKHTNTILFMGVYKKP